MDKLGDVERVGFHRMSQWPEKVDDIFGILPKARHEQYDMKEIIKRLVDDSAFQEYKKDYGKTIITAYARIDGWAWALLPISVKWLKMRRVKCSLEVSSTPTLRIKQLDL